MKKCTTIDSFLKTCSDSLSDRELLSLYLQYTESNPQEMANKMIAYYGTIANLIDTNPTYLKLAFSLKDETVALIHLLTVLRRRYLRIRSCTGEYLKDNDAIHRYLLPLFSGKQNEVMYLIGMNDDRKVLGCAKLSDGDLNSVPLSPRALAHVALLFDATVIVIAHNHPSGQATPSHADLSNTSLLQDSLASLGIRMLDHFIFANDSSQSIRHSDYLNGVRQFIR